MKIIIVEDDALIALQIETSITSLGHELLATFDNGAEAIEFVAQNRPDFVFMDIELSGAMDGIQCAAILKNKYEIPVLFVTSHDESEVIDEATRLEPLNFLPKPFTDKNIEAAIALARIKLKNHRPVQESTVVSMGDYTFNFEHNTLKCAEVLVKLSPKELKLVALLFKNIGNTVSVDELQNSIWEGEEISSAAFRKLISRTNERLDGLNIVSSKGVGYYLELG